MRLNRRSISIAVLLIAMAVISARLMFYPRDPVFNGKPLTQWVDEYSADSLTNRYLSSELQMWHSRPQRIREFGPSAIPALIRLVETKHPWKQKLYDFLKTHKVQNRWATDFVKKWPVESLRPQTAATFLSFFGPDAEPAIPALMRAAVDTNRALASTAIGALGAIHRQPDLVVPLLTKLAVDTNQSLALSAIVAVRVYTERPLLVVPALIQAISNQNSTPTDFRAIYAAQALPGFGTNALAAIPALRQLAANGPISTAFYAAETLQKIDPDSTADAVVAVYIRMLQDRNYSSPFSAILGLYGLGARARDAVPVLQAVISRRGSDSGMSEAAAYALKAIDPEAAAIIWPAELRRSQEAVLTNKSNWVDPETPEQFAARVLPMKDQAIPYLITLLKGTNRSYAANLERAQAAHLLGEMGPTAQAAIPTLVAITNELTAGRAALMKIRGESVAPLVEKLRDPRLTSDWANTASIVGEFGTNAESAVPLLLSASTLNPPTGFFPILEASARALGAIHRRPDLCVPALTPLLGNPMPNIRRTALEALVKFGADAKPAVPNIIESLDDLDYSARVAATNALKKIDPEAARKAGIE